MGKSARVRLSRQKPNTLYNEIPNISNSSDLDLSGLDSADELTCLGAITAISRLFYDEPDDDDTVKIEDTYEESIKNVVQYNFHLKLVSLLLNNSINVRLNAAGALKNICVAGGEEFCNLLYKKKVVSTLLPVIKVITMETTPVNINYLTNIIALCSVLCEESEKILMDLSIPEVLDKIFMIFSTGLSSDLSLLMITSEFLYVLSDSNQKFNNYLHESPNQTNIINVIQKADSPPMLLFYFIGIILNTSLNVNAMGTTFLFDTLFSKIILDITSLLAVDVTNETQVNTFITEINTQSLALEILSLFTLDALPDDDDMEEDQKPLSESLTLLLNRNIYNLLASLLFSIPSIQNLSSPAIQQALEIYVEYLIGDLNNLIENFPVQATQSNFDQLWTHFWVLFPSPNSFMFLWTVIRHAFENNVRVTIHPNQIAVLFNICNTSTSSENRMVAVGILDFVAQCYPEIPQQQFLDIFLNALADNSILVNAEAINGIIDMFSSDDPNPLWQSNNMISKLKVYQPQFQKKINTSLDDKASISHCKDMLTNLKEFIKYKNS